MLYKCNIAYLNHLAGNYQHSVLESVSTQLSSTMQAGLDGGAVVLDSTWCWRTSNRPQEGRAVVAQVALCYLMMLVKWIMKFLFLGSLCHHPSSCSLLLVLQHFPALVFKCNLILATCCDVWGQIKGTTLSMNSRCYPPMPQLWPLIVPVDH